MLWAIMQIVYFKSRVMIGILVMVHLICFEGPYVLFTFIIVLTTRVFE